MSSPRGTSRRVLRSTAASPTSRPARPRGERVTAPLDWLLLVGVATFSGGLNAVAGGGSFFTFPALLFAGVPAIPAYATNTVALWPASVSSAYGFREDMKHEKRELLILGAISLAGGLAGALLLLLTPERQFRALVPWLLLAATLILALGPRCPPCAPSSSSSPSTADTSAASSASSCSPP